MKGSFFSWRRAGAVWPFTLLVVLLSMSAIGAWADFTQPYTPDAHTMLLLHCDEGQGMPQDSSASHCLVDTRGVTWSNDGHFGKCLQFNGGQNSYLGLHGDALNIRGLAITVEAWVKPTDLDGDYGQRFIIGQGNGDGFQLGIDHGRPFFNVRSDDERTVGSGYSAQPIPLNTWTHVAGTYDGKVVRVFVNGDLAASSVVYGGELVSGGSDAVLGYRLDLAWHPEWAVKSCFQGLIDEVRVSNVVRQFNSKVTDPIPVIPPLREATTYFVDQAADNAADSNPGTQDKPFKTIGKAADAALAGDTVIIAPGTYREAITLKHAGTSAQPITFTTIKAGTVVISGADVITGWQAEPDSTGVYAVPWSHGPASIPFGKARPTSALESTDAVYWNGQPLQQVFKQDALAPGTFYADWDQHRLSLCLPGNRNPNSVKVEACVRGGMLIDASNEVKNIHLLGLKMRYAGGGINLHAGWRLENSLVEWCRFGVNVDGNYITLRRVTSQDNGGNGLAGCGNHLYIKDCTLLRNNRKGENPMDTTGGSKFLFCNHMTVDNLTSADNTGEGIWFDTRVRNYVIRNSKFYGNHGLTNDYEGIGIFLECDEGPGLLENNIIYSNTGAGVAFAESSNVIMRNNIVVDNGNAIELRDMPGRGDYHIRHIFVRNNVFKAWRNYAISTSIGEWDKMSPTLKQLHFWNNTYDPTPEKTALFKWGAKVYNTIDQVQVLLGGEKPGTIEATPFDYPLIPSKVLQEQAQVSIKDTLKHSNVGDFITLPAYGRTEFYHTASGTTCQIFDMQNTFVTLFMPDGQTKATVSQVQPYPLSEPVMVKVKLTKLDGDIEGTVVP
jgi:parallel beta-helix repeat protein